MLSWRPHWLTAKIRSRGRQESQSVPSNTAGQRQENQQIAAANSQRNLEKRTIGVKGAKIQRRTVSPSAVRKGTTSQRFALEKRNLIDSIEIDDAEPSSPESIDQDDTDVNGDAEKSGEEGDGDDRLDADEKKDTTAEVIIVAGPHLDRKDPANANWSSVEADLYDLLQDCGAEPMLPLSWKLDFPMLPDACFTESDAEVVIGSQREREHHGIRALKELFGAGSRARGRSLQGASPAKLLARAIQKYVKWVLSDGGLEQQSYFPVHCVLTAKEDSIGDAIGSIDDEMYRIRAHYRATGVRPKPVVFGVLLTRSVMTFLGLDTGKDDAEPRPIAVFDWAAEGQDAWGAMAVAILAMMIRATLQDILRTEKDIEADEKCEASGKTITAKAEDKED